MRESISIVTAAAAYPVSLAELKLYLRVTATDEDNLLNDLISTATDMVQEYLRKTLISTTLKLTMDGLPSDTGEKWWDGVRDGAISELHGSRDYILLPKAPVQSITSIVSYNDANAASTLSASAYRLDAAGDRVMLNTGYVWPSDLRDYQSVEVTYVAGYGDTSASVPASICMVIRQFAAKMYEKRGCEGSCTIDDGMKAQLSMHRRIDSIGNFR